MKEREIEHQYTSEIVCPYCGHEHSDSWELNHDSGEFECYECEKEFHYERSITVDYSTNKID